MHKLILWIFKILKDAIYFVNISGAFFIFLTSIYWIETLLKVNWKWLNFVKPILDTLLNFVYFILPFQAHPLVENINYKFIIAIGFIIIFIILLVFLLEKIQDLKYNYEKLHVDHILAVEKSLNKKLENNVKKEQSKITKYMIFISTTIKNKFSHKEINVDIDEQNKLLNNFIKEKTNINYQIFNNGFLYYFDNFDDIDDILDILFKVLKANTPIDCAISIQIGNEDNLNQLNKLSNLQQYGKIILCADTVLRYKCKKSHRYGTKSLGVYKTEEGTIDVHEFQEIL